MSNRLFQITSHLGSSVSSGLVRELTTSETLEARRLLGKCAVVTGGGNGIGAATAKFFALHGAKVIVADYDLEGATDVASEINDDFPGCALAVKVDVSSKEDNMRMIDLCVTTFGKIDILFANAGVMSPMVPIGEETEESFLRTLNVNTMGVFMGIKYASEAMKKSGGGSIVCTASIAALRADLTPLQYAASKGAVLSLVTSANDRLNLDKVRVNAVLPGGVMTGIVMGVAQNLYQQGLKFDNYDYRRFPTIDPTEIAKTVMFLASDDSSQIKGHALVIDGGMSQSMGSQPYPKKIKK